MRYLIDSNILLRLVHPMARDRPSAAAAVRSLLRQRHELVISSQNVVEFWSVVTRPVSANGLQMEIDLADRAVTKFERIFELVLDNPAVHERWRALVVSASVHGRQVHDARLAAVMLAHGISHILTFNTGDFERYPGVTAVHPVEVVPLP